MTSNCFCSRVRGSRAAPVSQCFGIGGRILHVEEAWRDVRTGSFGESRFQEGRVGGVGVATESGQSMLISADPERAARVQHVGTRLGPVGIEQFAPHSRLHGEQVCRKREPRLDEGRFGDLEALG